jgi:hypothetical protein
LNLQIKNETVYVIYHDGKPYGGSGRKLVYTSKSAANGVISREAKSEAEHRYHLARSYSTDCDWYELDLSVREDLINEMKKEFNIVEYEPKNT